MTAPSQTVPEAPTKSQQFPTKIPLSVGLRVHLALMVLNREKEWLIRESRLARKTVNNLLESFTLRPTPRTLEKLAHSLGVSTAWLIADAPRRRLTSRQHAQVNTLVRDLRKRLAGIRPRLVRQVDPRRKANARRESSLRVPRSFRSSGARDVYRVKGESLTGLGLYDGDLVYVRPLNRGNARSAVGGIVLVDLNGKLFLKQLTIANRDSGGLSFDLYGRAPRDLGVSVVVLRSAHPAYPPITLTAADQCKPLGHVVASVRNYIEP